MTCTMLEGSVQTLHNQLRDRDDIDTNIYNILYVRREALHILELCQIIYAEIRKREDPERQ